MTCQNGAEPVLKKELSQAFPAYRFAFSRPGFLTFKASGPDKQIDLRASLNLIFSRAWGTSLGKIRGDGDVKAKSALAEAVKLLGKDKTLRLHVWERDFHAPGEEPQNYVRGALAKQARAEILGLAGDVFYPEAQAQDGDRVFDVVIVEENEWWFGFHIHGQDHSPFAGGLVEIDLPKESPSRAYLKIEEALLWTGVKLKAGETALEVGSAPGGATYALLQRGLFVIGVDPGRMDPEVRAHPKFRFIGLSVKRVERGDLPEKLDWILLDVHVEPEEALAEIARIVGWFRGSLKGAFLTLKLNDWSLAAEIPRFLAKVKAMGFTDIRAKQLASNRQEFFVYGALKS
jgi:23S rRNA (cytidine2498-2'-O)-methyltransferase